MTYTYDLGDDWELEVKPEKNETSGDTPAESEIVEMHSESPRQHSRWKDDDEW